MAKNPIPAEYPSWGRFDELAERNIGELHRILDGLALAKAKRGSAEQKLGDFYASGMDMQRIDAEGLKPLADEMRRVEAVKDRASLRAEVGRLQGYGINVPFVFGSGQDAKESTRVIGQALQGGLGLPDRDYYLKDDQRYQDIRKAYVAHVAKMFELAGEPAADAKAHAETVMRFETRLAEASMTLVDQRDPNKIYNKTAVADLAKLTPNFDWAAYFREIGAPPMDAVNVQQPDFFRALDKEIAGTPMADWQTYLRWHLLDATARALSQKFVDEDFDFKGRVLTGTAQNQPLWKRRVRATDRALGDALGRIYVEKNFTPEAKARALEMINNLAAALEEDIGTLDWMSDATRRQAVAKLKAFARKIGYPERWRDYSKLEIDRGPYVLNVLRATKFEFDRDLAKIGRPLDRTDWDITPPTVNAYYNPTLNEIVFPAGILQPPFFDPNADDAINYGGIGAVIGHEMTHGFDDEGAQFDAEGNLKNWFAEGDLEKFQARAKCVEEQFGAYAVEDGTRLNGKLVAGESIADLGGLAIAYAALQRSMAGKPRPADVDGFTPEQRFFLGWAQVWAENDRPEFVKLLVDTDPHPVSSFRVNGPLSNMQAFAAAYGCKEGDPMVRPASARCRIW
jgi:predicted metalloendopeptidase